MWESRLSLLWATGSLEKRIPEFPFWLPCLLQPIETTNRMTAEARSSYHDILSKVIPSQVARLILDGEDFRMSLAAQVTQQVVANQMEADMDNNMEAGIMTGLWEYVMWPGCLS